MSWPRRASYRRSRGSGIGGILKQIAKDQAKYNDGEIHVLPNGYKFSDSGYTNPGGVFIAPHHTADGRMASLISGQRTATNCPQPPGDFPIFEDQHGRRCYVPMKDCRKCEFHLKRRRGQPYPCCALLRESRRGGPSPIAKVLDTLAEAAKGVNEIMGHSSTPAPTGGAA